MILIADSGSTKTTWCIIDSNRNTKTIQTEGINPIFQTKESILHLIEKQIKPHTKTVNTVHFYGAGCTDEKSSTVCQALQETLAPSTINVQTDLLGATYALCKKHSGIISILGTGSNSALYDGEKIIQQTPALGYILGDEGSGATLGRQLINLLFKNQLPTTIKEDFKQSYQLSQAQIIEKVYQGEFPNRFLASFAPFVAKHISQPIIKTMVKQSFNDFVQKNLLQYTDAKTLPIHFVGAIAHHFQPILKQVLQENQLNIGKIKKSPIKGLVKYHIGYEK